MTPSLATAPAIRRRPNPAEPAPLSFAQERLWVLAQVDPHVVAYAVPVLVRLRGVLNFVALNRSVRGVVHRHEVLRTVFQPRDQAPVQVVLPDVTIPLDLVDLSGLDPSRREPELRRQVARAVNRPIDLACGPMLRCHILRVAPRDHAVLFTLHHIVADGRSVQVIAQELSTLYDAFDRGASARMPDLPLQYADFATWQRERLNEHTLEPHLAYWRAQLDGDPPSPELSADFAPAPGARRRAGRQFVHLPLPLVKTLTFVSRRHDITLFGVLLAAFAVLLYRYTARTDVVIAFDASERSRSELDGLIGPFVNTLICRVDLAGRPSCAATLDRVRKVLLDAYGHRDMPFEKLVQALQLRRDANGPLLSRIGFSLQRATEDTNAGHATADAIAVSAGFAKFSLAINLTESPAGVAGTLEYDADLFEDGSIDRLRGAFVHALKGIASDPDRPIDTLPLMTPAERRAQVVSGVAAEASADSVAAAFIRQAARTPDAHAVSDGVSRWNYHDLHARAAAVAARLADRGIGLEHRVAVLGPRDASFLAAMLGCLLRGAAYVPVDPDAPIERVKHTLSIADPAAVLVPSTFASVLAQTNLGDRLLPLETPSIGASVLSVPPVLPRAGLDAIPPEALAYVIFTSGSTGVPKGAMIEHRGLMNHLQAKITDLGITDADVIAQTAVQSFDISIWQFLAPLLVGGAVRIVSRDAARDPQQLLAILDDEQVTIAETVPSMLRLVLDAASGDAARRLSGLRWMLATGEDLPPPLVRHWFERFPHVPLLNAYGPTECSDDVSHFVMREPLASRLTRTPIGTPILGTRLVVADDRLDVVPQGMVGHLHVGGAGVGRGYLHDAARTAEQFVPDPFTSIPGARLYRTGDRARWRTGGALEFLGRLDRQVKIRGARIEPGDIEAALARQPGVRQAAVLAHAARLIAYVEMDPAGTMSIDDVRDRLRQALPESMVPAAFVRLDRLPLLPSGKVDVKALPPPPADRPDAVAFAPPSSVTQERLAAIWARLLDLPSVGIDDEFFSLGGHSLMAIGLRARVREAFDADLPLRLLFEGVTVRRLAAAIDARRLETRPPHEAAPLVRADVTGPRVLSFAQRRLWFLGQLWPEDVANHIPGAIALDGRLDVAALRASIADIIDRHDTLRTVFVVDRGSGEPRQIVRERPRVVCPVVDVNLLTAAQRDAESRRLAHADAATAFRLDRDCPFRVRLMRAHADAHILQLTLHHIAADAWSLGVLVREITALYAARVEGCPSPLEALPVQYADYAEWQQATRREDHLTRQSAYWRRQLDGAPTELRLPLDRPRPSERSSRGDVIPLDLPAELVARARAFSAGERATVFMTLFAAFQTLMFRCTGQRDILTGTDVAGRDRTETEPLIGLFVNQVVVRTSFEGQPTFRAMVRQVRDVALEAFAHQDVPFEEVVEMLAPRRSLAQTPVVQVSCQMLHTTSHARTLPGLVLRPMDLARQIAKYDLAVVFDDQRDALSGALVYSADLFDPETAQLWAERYRTLLDRVLRDPDTNVEAVDLLGPTERQLLHDGVDSMRRPVTTSSVSTLLHDRLEREARAGEEAAALIWQGGQLSRRDVSAWSNRLAHRLRRCGAGPEVRVGVLVDRSPACVMTVLAILKAGAAYVPLDSRWPDTRLIAVARRACVGILAGAATVVERLSTHFSQVIRWDAIERELWRMPATPVRSGVQPDNAAYVIHTSGSTGVPKGVVVSHAGLAHFAEAFREAVDWTCVPTPARVSLNASLTFDASVQALVRLSEGDAVVLFPEDVRRDPREFAQALDRLGVDVFDCTSSQMALLLEHGFLDGSRRRPRIVLLGGEPIEPAQWRTLAAAPDLDVYNVYGPTECVVEVTACRLTGGVPAIGRPMRGVSAQVVDRSGNPTPIGVEGELWLGGRSLARGYLDAPVETAVRFCPDPFASTPGARLYRTGDLVRRRRDGTLIFVGRADHQVKIRGVRIEPGEIEACARQCPGVAACVVTADLDGTEARRLVLYFVAQQGMTVTSSELATHVRRHLPEAMWPAVYVPLERMPLTGSGKVDRSALPVPDSIAAGEDSSKSSPPRGAIEELLAEIWAESLQAPRISRESHFFELGGHSLLATRVVARVRAVMSADVPLKTLFEEPTLAGFAAAVIRARAHAQPVDPPLVRRDQREAPLSHAQERLWFLHELAPTSHAYTICGGMRLHGRLRLAALRRSVAAVVERHEMLRTRFVSRAEGPVQVIDPPGSHADLRLIDVQGLPAVARATESARLGAVAARQPFDLTRGPLLRVWVVRLSADDHVIVYTLPHIVADGWSMGVLLREMGALYAAETAGKPLALPPLPVQYADYATWQRTWTPGALESGLTYWREQLAGAPARLALPTAGRRATAGDAGASVYAVLDPTLTLGLKALGRRQGTTLFMTLLAGFAALLARMSGQQDLVIGTDVAGRTRPETEDLIGFFINQLPLRLDLSGAPTFETLLARVRETCLNAYAHQDVPFERIVREVSPERSLDGTPLFDVLFDYRLPADSLSQPGFSAAPLAVETFAAQLDLMLAVTDRGDHLDARLEYRTDLFEAHTMSTWLDRWQALLRAAVMDPSKELDDLLASLDDTPALAAMAAFADVLDTGDLS